MRFVAGLLLALWVSVGAVVAQEQKRLPNERLHGPLEVVAAFHDNMPTGVTVSDQGRIFVNFPRWGDDVPFTVAEVKNGKPVAFPNAEMNRADTDNPQDSFLSVQSVVIDPEGTLWVLDTLSLIHI